MRKRISGKKLNRTTNERKQLFRQLTKSLAIHGYLVTTEAQAAAIKPIVERLVNLAKDKSVTNFRQLVSVTGDFGTAKKLTEIGAVFSKRSGGYTRIFKIGRRSGDSAELVRLEWVEKLVVAEPVIKPETASPHKVKLAKEPAKPAPKKIPALKKRVTKP